MKRHDLLNVVSTILYFAGFLSLFEAYSRIKQQTKVPILLYHSISSPNTEISFLHHKVISAAPEIFERQINYLRKKYNIISLEHYVSMRASDQIIPKKSVILTFDDGYYDNFKYAYPILKATHTPATIFISPGLIDSQKSFWSNELASGILRSKLSSITVGKLRKYDLSTRQAKLRAADQLIDQIKGFKNEQIQQTVDRILEQLHLESNIPSSPQPYLSWEQIRTMAQNGISFGAHTLSHVNLCKVSSSTARKEIEASKQRIETELNIPVKSFAYPFGGMDCFNDHHTNVARDVGFSCACTTLFGRNTPSQDLFRLRRIPIFYYHNMNVFKAKVIGIFDYFDGIDRWAKKSMTAGRQLKVS